MADPPASTLSTSSKPYWSVEILPKSASLVTKLTLFPSSAPPHLPALYRQSLEFMQTHPHSSLCKYSDITSYPADDRGTIVSVDIERMSGSLRSAISLSSVCIWTESDLLANILGLVETLAAAQRAVSSRQGWTHRQINPDHLLVAADNSIKVVNFALKANFLDVLAAGDPAFFCSMRKERALDDYDPAKGDVYSLGLCFLHAVYTGYPEALEALAGGSVADGLAAIQHYSSLHRVLAQLLEQDQAKRLDFEGLDAWLKAERGVPQSAVLPGSSPCQVCQTELGAMRRNQLWRWKVAPDHSEAEANSCSFVCFARLLGQISPLSFYCLYCFSQFSRAESQFTGIADCDEQLRSYCSEACAEAMMLRRTADSRDLPHCLQCGETVSEIENVQSLDCRDRDHFFCGEKCAETFITNNGRKTETAWELLACPACGEPFSDRVLARMGLKEAEMEEKQPETDVKIEKKDDIRPFAERISGLSFDFRRYFGEPQDRPCGVCTRLGPVEELDCQHYICPDCLKRVSGSTDIVLCQVCSSESLIITS